jgi:hypothetical protein
LVDYVEQVLDSVLLQADPDEKKHNLIAGILDGIALSHSANLEDWKRRASNYPDELAEAVVRRHAQIDHFWRSEMMLARAENRMMLYDMFTQVEKQLLHVLLGINHVYYFGFKWLETVDARLRYKPRDLWRVSERSRRAGSERLGWLPWSKRLTTWSRRISPKWISPDCAQSFATGAPTGKTRRNGPLAESPFLAVEVPASTKQRSMNDHPEIGLERPYQAGPQVPTEQDPRSLPQSQPGALLSGDA